MTLGSMHELGVQNLIRYCLNDADTRGATLERRHLSVSRISRDTAISANAARFQVSAN